MKAGIYTQGTLRMSIFQFFTNWVLDMNSKRDVISLLVRSLQYSGQFIFLEVYPHNTTITNSDISFLRYFLLTKVTDKWYHSRVIRRQQQVKHRYVWWSFGNENLNSTGDRWGIYTHWYQAEEASAKRDRYHYCDVLWTTIFMWKWYPPHLQHAVAPQNQKGYVFIDDYYKCGRYHYSFHVTSDCIRGQRYHSQMEFWNALYIHFSMWTIPCEYSWWGYLPCVGLFLTTLQGRLY